MKRQHGAAGHGIIFKCHDDIICIYKPEVLR